MNLFTDAELLRMSEARYRKLNKMHKELIDTTTQTQLNNINLRIQVRELEKKLCLLNKEEN